MDKLHNRNIEIKSHENLNIISENQKLLENGKKKREKKRKKKDFVWAKLDLGSLFLPFFENSFFIY